VKDGKAGLQLMVRTSFSVASHDADYVISQANDFLTRSQKPAAVKTVDEAACVIGNGVKDRLESKLHLGEGFSLVIAIYEDWKRQIYGNECKSH
jgi:hypothetical protein